MRGAVAGIAILGSGLAVVVWLTTPWQVMPAGAMVVAPDPAREFSAAQLARSAAFDAAISPPGYVSMAIGLIFAAVLVFTPRGTRLLGRLPGPEWVRVLLGVAAVSIVTSLLTLIPGIWSETVLRAYGLSTQTWGSWTGDRLISLGVSFVLTTIMIIALWWLARRFPRRWWLPAAIGAFALTVVVSFGYPVVVEPLFNKFRPMPPGPLRTTLLELAERDRVPVDQVLVADASRRTTALNAYVSGFGATKRIVVYDTLLEKASPDEVALVVAHELGHAKNNDVLYGTLVGGLAAGFGACLLFVLVPAFSRRNGTGSVADPRAVAVLMGTITLVSTLSGPLENVISRHVESRADEHALALTNDPATFAAMQHTLATENISDLSPNWFEYVFYFSHPSAAQRIAMARSYAEWKDLPSPTSKTP